MSQPIKIGIFDSGLGGLTVLRSCLDFAAQQGLHNAQFIYLGDNARVPYGSKSPSTIKRYGLECASFLKSRHTEYVIVACNTVSAYALAQISEVADAYVIGTIGPAVEQAITQTSSKHIGVIGTAATCASGAYERAIKEMDASVTVTSIPCPLFVPIVEQGMFEGEIVDKIIELYLAPLKNSTVDTLILGCTHYPLLQTALKKFLGDAVTLVACSDAIARQLLRHMSDAQRDKSPSRSTGSPTVQFYVTDELTHFNALAEQCLKGVKVHSEVVAIESNLE